jgi:hypothetical protein
VLCLAVILANYNMTYFIFIRPVSMWRSIPVVALSKASRLLGLQVRIPREARMFVSCGCCMMSGRGLGAGLITFPEESYSVLCV